MLGVEIAWLFVVFFYTPFDFNKQSLGTIAYTRSVETSLNCKILPKLMWSFSDYFIIKQIQQILVVSFSIFKFAGSQSEAVLVVTGMIN